MAGQYRGVDDPFDVRRDGAILLRLQVQPGARHPGILGRHGDALKVAVTAPADRGKANDAVLGLVAEVLGVRRASVELVGGASSRTKRVAVQGRTAEQVRTALGNALEGGAVARRRP